MTEVGIAELKARLSEYIARARAGEAIVVCDRKRPVVRLIPVERDLAPVAREATRPASDFWGIRGIKPGKPVDIERILRESRDQR